MPFSHLWSGISGLGTPPHSADFIGDASPPFTELTESGYGLVPTSWELARIRYYHSKIRMKDSNSVVRILMIVLLVVGWLRDY